MKSELESVFSAVTADEFTTVARGALGLPAATLAGPPALSEITTPHYDQRTIGIVRVQGTAGAPGSVVAWSAVGKLISEAGKARDSLSWLNLDAERQVYSQQLFVDDNLALRPAHCYLISHPTPETTLIWLEDLSGATGPPFNLDQLVKLARDLGEFNGFHAVNSPELPFELKRDGYRNRWRSSPLLKRADELQDMASREAVRRAFRGAPTSIMPELGQAITRVGDRAMELSHSLAFGDSQPGNFFIDGDETVAIDWSGVSVDPTGVDPGTLVGSALAWGTHGGEMAANERRVFDAYVEGLHKGGWTGTVDDVRRVYLSTFGLYLMHMGGTIPMSVAEPGSVLVQSFLEGRFGCELEEIPEHVAPIIQLIPEFLEEMRQLAV